MVTAPGPDRLPVPEPRPDRQRRPLARWVHRRLRRAGCALVVLVVTFVALVGAVAVVLGGEQEDASGAGSVFDREKPRAAPSSGSATIDLITRRGRLVVAVQELPGLASRGPATRDWAGFDVEIARLIAADLGVDPTRTAFKPIAGRSREAALGDGDVDLVLGYTSTDARRAQVGFAGPYLSSPQRLAVPPGSPVTGPAALGDGRVCVAEGSAVAAELAGQLGERLVARSAVQQCLSRLGREAAALAGDEVVLRELVAENPGELAIVGEPLGHTDYGVGLRPGDEVLRARVSDVLRRAVADGTWSLLYAEHLGTPAPQPPTVGP